MTADEISQNEEMLFLLIKQAKDSQDQVNVAISRLEQLADKLDNAEVARNEKLDSLEIIVERHENEQSHAIVKGIEQLQELAKLEPARVSDTIYQATKQAVIERLNDDVISQQKASFDRVYSKLESRSSSLEGAVSRFYDIVSSVDNPTIRQFNEKLASNLINSVQAGVSGSIKSVNDTLSLVNGSAMRVNSDMKKFNSDIEQARQAMQGYYDSILLPKHLKLMGMVGGGVTVAMLLIFALMYAVFVPSRSERAELQGQIDTLKQQATELSKASVYDQTNNKYYVKIDKNDCRDNNFCARKP